VRHTKTSCYSIPVWIDTRKEGEITWEEIVIMYSGLQLTFRSDRLVAILGVARLMHNKTGDEYVAGLWKEQLPSQLLWAPSPAKARSSIGSVPFWSWISIDGPIKGWGLSNGCLFLEHCVE
jgi:hypothetical protein